MLARSLFGSGTNQPDHAASQTKTAGGLNDRRPWVGPESQATMTSEDGEFQKWGMTQLVPSILGVRNHPSA